MIQRQKLDALTSLRFIAAAMIVVSHAHPIFGSWGVATAAPLGQGVSFFFVLSGFILAYNYPQMANASERRHFWLARFARVFPLHVVTLLLWLAIIFSFDRQTYFPGGEGVLKLMTNLLLLQAWVPLKEWSLSFNGVSWSLSAEFFFYLCFPLLISHWKKNWHVLLAIQAVVVLAFIIGSTHYNLPAGDENLGVGLLGLIYFNPLVRIFEFSVGITVAHLVQQIRPSSIKIENTQWLLIELGVLVCIFISLLAAANFSGIGHVLGEATAYYVTRQGLWLPWALLIGVFALSKGPIAKCLSTKPLIFLGEISFALYLSHALIIHYIEPYTQRIHPYGFAGYVVFWAALLMFSAALFLGIEQPARRLILSLAGKNRGDGGCKFGAIKVERSAWVALAVLVLCVAGLLALRPSSIQTLDQQVIQNFMGAPDVKVIQGAGVFGGRYSLLALRPIRQANGKVEVELLMQAKQDLHPSEIIAVHLNDTASNIVDKLGDQLVDKAARTIPAGSYWIQRFPAIESARYDGAASIGVAIYNTPEGLLPVDGAASDWDGRRLIVRK